MYFAWILIAHIAGIQVISYVRTLIAGKYPENWTEMENDDFRKLVLNPDSDEYDSIARDFLQTLPSADIVKIFRIQNTVLWRKYEDCSERMLQHDRGVLGEKTLFHGTRNTDPEEIYRGGDGFDLRHSAGGMWGEGNYFAQNSSYCDNCYAYKGDGLKLLFAAWVLTGRSCPLAPDRNIKLPPYINDGGQVRCRYDSVTGITGGSRVFITYDNDHAYPAYLIAYKNQ